MSAESRDFRAPLEDLKVPRDKENILEAMTWIFSAPFPGQRGRMMDEPAAASWQIREFWQMFDARSVFHLKGNSAFQVLPSSPWSLGIQLSGGQQISGNIIRAPSNPWFPSLGMDVEMQAECRRDGTTKIRDLKLDIEKNWILGMMGWQQQCGPTFPGVFFQEMDPFITF